MAGKGQTPPTPIMRMGCPNTPITYRQAGYETVCLKDADRGEQVLYNFNAANGDIIGVDDVLEQTLCPDNLAGVGNWITSQSTQAGTTLYFDPTGTGQTGTPFAFLSGVQTTVAQLVADGGMQYIPDQVVITPAFDTPVTIRPGGLTTIDLRATATGIAAQEITNFSAAAGDNLQLKNILNYTTAAPDLSNIGNYISATTVNGNTILSVDTTGTGQAGTPFAELMGVSATLSQLVSENALIFTPTAVNVLAAPNMTFICRPEGEENVAVVNVHGSYGPTTIQDFSLANDDQLNLVHVLAAANVQADLANIGNFVSLVDTGGNTQVWFNANGNGQGGGTMECVLQNTSITLDQLLAHSGLNLS
jgi:hypothetical protein